MTNVEAWTALDTGAVGGAHPPPLGQRVILARNLFGTLRTREPPQAAKDIATDTGLEYRPVADGQRVAGIYRRSVLLASGRYAMLDGSMGFSLVPWKTRDRAAACGNRARWPGVVGDWATEGSNNLTGRVNRA